MQKKADAISLTVTRYLANIYWSRLAFYYLIFVFSGHVLSLLGYGRKRTVSIISNF